MMLTRKWRIRNKFYLSYYGKRKLPNSTYTNYVLKVVNENKPKQI